MQKTYKPDPRLLNFKNFLFLVWAALRLPNPTKVQYQVAEYLQSGPRRAIIEAFRGVGKSWITVAYVLWVLYCDPQKKILVVSASKQLADNFTTFCFQLIDTMPLLAHLRPGQDQRSSKVQFDVGPAMPAKDPSVRSVGITGQLTGGRADLIVADDIESANNSLTQTSRDRLSEAIKEFDAVLKPGGTVRYLGTPQTELSIYNLLPSRNYEIRIWPSRYPDERWMTRNGRWLAPELASELAATPEIVGSPTDPHRFSDEDLEERAMSYGRSGYALQFQLDTSLADLDRYPLKLGDLVVMDVDRERAPEFLAWASAPHLAYGNDLPNVGMQGDRYYRPMTVSEKWLPYTGTIMSIDPSGRGSDELGYCVASMLNGYIFVPEVSGMHGGYSPENLEKLARVAKEYKVNQIVIETNFGDGMFTALLKPVLARIHPCAIEEVRHNKQKELRIIDTLEPVMNQHRLVIAPSVFRREYEESQRRAAESPESYLLARQLSRITKERGALRHDDRLDALAIAVTHWIEALAQDAERNVKDRKDEELDRELERFLAGPDWREDTQRNANWLQMPPMPTHLK